MSNRASAIDIAERYCGVVDRILGAFLEASMGMGTLAKGWIEWHMQVLDEVESESDDAKGALLNPSITLTGTVNGAAGDLHATTLDVLIARNSVDGENWTFFANLCIISMYAFWEDEYRGELATALNCAKNDIKDDTFGELRHLRRSIVHNAARALPEVSRNHLLKQFPTDAPIVLTSQELIDIAAVVKEAARRVGMGTSGPAA